MFGLISRRKYDDLKLDSDCRIQCLAKQNEGLWDRIRAGEDYRRELEQKNAALLADNSILYAGRENARIMLRKADMKIKDLELRLGSMEAQWCQKTGAEV